MTSRVRGILFQRVATRSLNTRIVENFCNLAGRGEVLEWPNRAAC